METLKIYKALATVNRHLAELKGRASVIPNQGILIDTLSLQEAKASSEIENIVTTQDDLFKAEVSNRLPSSGPVKEVALYRDAMKLAWDQMKATKGIISNRSLISIFQMLKSIDGGFRSTGGTILQRSGGKVVYVPPQIPDNINRHMSALDRFVNDDEMCELDPLIKMALIHHQFESIHPFPDGNSRIGRILNVLYLTRTGLLDTPILYLSRYITENKTDYYRLLQAIRDADNESDRSVAWQNWILYMLTAVSETAQTTLALVIGIRDQMASIKTGIRDGELTKMYSQDLVNNLFRHPYTRIEFIETELLTKSLKLRAGWSVSRIEYPCLDTVVFAMPFAWRGTLQQHLGRLARASPGKQDIRVIDVHDTGHPMLVSMWRMRMRMRGYRALGWREVTKKQLFGITEQLNPGQVRFPQ